jgi:hypothetical protein
VRRKLKIASCVLTRCQWVTIVLAQGEQRFALIYIPHAVSESVAALEVAIEFLPMSRL